jgi:hypothetical protein
MQCKRLLICRQPPDLLAVLKLLNAASAETDMIAHICQREKDQLETSGFTLPDRMETAKTDEYRICNNSVALLNRCQPGLLCQWMPVHTYGDGNCLFRALSLLLYGTENHHISLRLIASLEIGLHRDYYDKDVATCHFLLQNNAIINPSYAELFREVTSYATNSCIVQMIAISSALEVRISSYFPPLQTLFVSPLTVEITGRTATVGRSVAIMWTSVGDVIGSGEVDINHFVPLTTSKLTTVVDNTAEATPGTCYC